MSAIHYKFRSALEYKTLTFEGLQLTVAELKRLIYENEKINRSADFDLQITNAQTKMSYDDDNTMVPRNASVVIARIPASNPQKLPKVWDKSTEGVVQRNRPGDKIRSFGSSNALYERVDLTKKTDMTEEEKLKEMERLSTRDYDPSTFVRRRAVMSGPAPLHYICSRCNQSGHWISDCPLLNMRRTTGIPKDELMETTPDDPQAMLAPDGSYAVSILHKAAKIIGKKEKPPFLPDDSARMDEKMSYVRLKTVLPPELVCKLCGELLRDAVLIKCCCMSFCDECVRGCLLESERHECPYCHALDIDPDSLLPNAQLRQAVNSFRNESGYVRSASSSRFVRATTPPTHSGQSQADFALARRSLVGDVAQSSTAIGRLAEPGGAIRSHRDAAQFSSAQPQFVPAQSSSYAVAPAHQVIDRVNLAAQSQPNLATPPSYPFSGTVLQQPANGPSSGPGSVTVIPASFGAAAYPTASAAAVVVAATSASELPTSSTPTPAVLQPSHIIVPSGTSQPPVVQYAALPPQLQPPPPGVASVVSFTPQQAPVVHPQRRPLTEEEFYLEKQRLLRKIKPIDEWEEFLERKDRNKRRESRSPSSSSYESSISRRSSKSRSRSRSREKRRERRRSSRRRRYKRSASRDASRRRRQRRRSRSSRDKSYSRSPDSPAAARRRRRSSSSNRRRRSSPSLPLSLALRDLRQRRNFATTTRFGGAASALRSSSLLQASFLNNHQPLQHIVHAAPPAWLPPPPSLMLCPPGVDASFARSRFEYETSAVAPPPSTTATRRGGSAAADKRATRRRSSSSTSDAESRKKTSKRRAGKASKKAQLAKERKEASTEKSDKSGVAESGKIRAKLKRKSHDKANNAQSGTDVGPKKVKKKENSAEIETKIEQSDSIEESVAVEAINPEKQSSELTEMPPPIEKSSEEKLEPDLKASETAPHQGPFPISKPIDISNLTTVSRPRRISIELKTDHRRVIEKPVASGDTIPAPARRASTPPPAGVRTPKQIASSVSLSPTIIFKPLEIVASRINYKKSASTEKTGISGAVPAPEPAPEAFRKPPPSGVFLAPDDEYASKNFADENLVVELKGSVDDSSNFLEADDKEESTKSRKKAKKEKRKHKRKHHKKKNQKTKSEEGQESSQGAEIVQKSSSKKKHRKHRHKKDKKKNIERESSAENMEENLGKKAEPGRQEHRKSHKSSRKHSKRRFSSDGERRRD